MKLWNKRWVRFALLAMLAVACTAAVGEARHFFRWWFAPPAPAIENSDYVGEASGGRFRQICVVDGEFAGGVRAKLESAEFTATVTDGVLSVDPIDLAGSSTEGNTSTTTQVQILVDEAELIRTYFSSLFRAQGEAIVTVTVDVTDDAGDVTTTTTTTVVPVILFGSIHRHGDEGAYHLRGAIRGLLREEDETTGKITYSLISVRLNAKGEVIVEEVPPEVPSVS